MVGGRKLMVLRFSVVIRSDNGFEAEFFGSEVLCSRFSSWRVAVNSWGRVGGCRRETLEANGREVAARKAFIRAACDCSAAERRNPVWGRDLTFERRQ